MEGWNWEVGVDGGAVEAEAGEVGGGEEDGDGEGAGTTEEETLAKLNHGD